MMRQPQPNPRQSTGYQTEMVSRYLNSSQAIKHRTFHDEKLPILESEARIVGINRLGITTPSTGKPYIGTVGLLCCVGIAIYDPDIQVAGVAHLAFGQGFPNPMISLCKISCDLIAVADKASGSDKEGKSKYNLFYFNISEGSRMPEETIALQEISLATVKGLYKIGKLRGFEFRDERDFLIDSRSGELIVGRL